jgi:UDP-N-acetylglucosamine:LPS N-acetylglucosamine transferase
MSAPTIEILYADSGSGHFSVGQALAAAIQAGGANYIVRLVNGREISPMLFGGFARLYPFLINSVRGLYSLSYRLADGYWPSRLIELFLQCVWGGAARRYVIGRQVALYISCHQITSLLMPGIVHRYSMARIASVITDPFTPHADSFSRQVDRCLVSSEQARAKALQQRLSPAQIRLVGHPTQPDFLSSARERRATLEGLGLNSQMFTVLVTGGGDGLGKIAGVVAALAASDLPIQIIVVCGRNRQLYEYLARGDFRLSVRLLALTDDMPSLLCAADALVAKAGPSTIFEAFLAGLPLVLFDVIMGQEAGNVSHMCENGAGFFCPSPAGIVDAVRILVSDPARHATMSACSKRLAQPDVAHDAARACLELL